GGWRIGSFSALAQGATNDAAAIDHDARVVEPTDRAGSAPATPDDIVRFPRGAAAGECLHAVLERIDFARQDGWPATIAAALDAVPPRRGADDPRLVPMVERMLRDLVATPLPIGGAKTVRLASVTP